MNVGEMLRLQGMDRLSFKQVVTDRQMGAQIGNAMSQNVIERILCKLLPAAGLVAANTVPVDRWQTSVKKGEKRRREEDATGSSKAKRLLKEVDAIASKKAKR